jgi:hypothetical protein
MRKSNSNIKLRESVMEKLDFNQDSRSQKTENPTIGRTLSFAERFANL